MNEGLNSDKYFRLWWLLIETAFLAAKARNKELSEYDITMEQAGILFCIKALGDNVTSAELGRQRGRERNTMSEALTTMARKGLIIKKKDKVNKNQLRISLSAEGRKIIDEYDKRESIKTSLADLSNEEIDLMEKMCRKVHNKTLTMMNSNGHKEKAQKLLIDSL